MHAQCHGPTGAHAVALNRLRFGPLARDLSRLVLGTALYRRAPEDISPALLDEWRELGGNVVDTAREYGTSEAILGRWMEARGCRDEMVVVTKCAHPENGESRLTRAEVSRDLAESLEALRTSYVDLLLLHRDDVRKPVGRVLEILTEHVEAGRVRACGASNWTIARLDEAREYARAHGLDGLACSSAQLSLAVQKEPMWPGTLSARSAASRRWHEETSFPLLAWSAQASGFFARDDAAAGDPDVARVYDSEQNRERRRRAGELARAKGVPRNAVALAWVLAQRFPTYAVVGPLSVEELRSSVTGDEITLTHDEGRWLALEDENG